jgi:hypothetical protein
VPHRARTYKVLHRQDLVASADFVTTGTDDSSATEISILDLRGSDWGQISIFYFSTREIENRDLTPNALLPTAASAIVGRKVEDETARAQLFDFRELHRLQECAAWKDRH